MISGAATLASTLNVTGSTVLASSLNVSGAATLSSVSTSEAAAVGTTLNVTGATALASTLSVTGASSFTGNVGIGTASPAFVTGYSGAQINSTSAGTQIRLTNPTTSATATSGLSLALDVSAGYVWQYSNMPLVLGLITSNAPTGGPAISATGKTSTNVAADIEINRAGTVTNVGHGATLQFNDSVTATNSRLIQAGAGNFQFFGYGTGGWVEHARLDLNGSLCVGATATNYGTQDIGVFNRSQNDITRLMVNNQSQGASAQTMLELASYGASWRMYVPSSTNNTNPLIFVGTGAGGGEKMRLTYDGKLLIGRTVDDGSTG